MAGLTLPGRRRLGALLAPALLAVLLVAAGAGAGGRPAQGQAGTPDIAELRKAIAVRDAQGAGRPEQTVAAAQAYLADYAAGRYADEVLLALAQGHAQLGHPELALQAYNRIVENHPDSPFREQALAESLPLLREQGDPAGAFARVDALVQAYPHSLERSKALLWKAGAQYEQGDTAATLATLKRIDPAEDLAGAQEADYYRLQTLALVKSGESAWTPLQRYLKRDDTPEHKAEVLMVVGEVARKAERPDEALRFYGQVVEDYPVPAHLGEALYWRAELFARTRLADAPDSVRGPRRETAIGYYSGYLEHGSPEHRAEALAGRAALQQEAGRGELALADYEQAVQLKPALGTDPKIVRARVTLLSALGRPEQGVALLEAARTDPTLDAQERTAFQVQQAALHYDAKQCEQVEALLNPMPIIADAQLRPRAFFMRGFCRYQREEWEKATFDLEGLINDPDYQQLALEPLLDAYEKSGQTSRLVNLAEELLKAGRVKPTAALLLRLANGYEKLGEPGLMLSALQRMEQADPAAAQAPEIQLRMGLARERLGQREAAAANFRAVLAYRKGEERAPPETYLAALEHLQGLALAEGKLEALPPLHKAAEAILSEPAHKARLAALKRDVDVALAERELQGGKAKAAVPRLESALKQTPAEQPERRARVAALLMTAYARTDAGDKGEALYHAEAKGDGKGDDKAAYRARLASTVIATVQAQPDAFKAGGQRKGMVGVYKLALADLPPEQSQQRFQAAQALDRVYQEQGDHAARAALLTSLLKDGYDDKTKRELRLHQARVYTDWGKALLDKGDTEGAQFQLQRARELSTEADWRQRYEVTALLSRVQLQRKEYSALVQMNEAVLPEVEDKALAAQLRHFLGQVYVEWGKAAEEEGNVKSARIRYEYALDYLPETDWQRRLAATNGLAKALQQQDRADDAAAAYEAVLPQIADADVKQQYAFYLGRIYAERVKDPAKASQWFRAADRGGKDPVSLEAGYLWADQQLAAERGDVALTRLKELAARGIAGSKWDVPIHYRIAVLLHQRKDLKDALAHYRIVAAAKGDEVRKLYPRSIEQSREQVRRIEAFLKAGGGQGDIAVPTVRPD
jgi:hypothetical protein